MADREPESPAVRGRPTEYSEGLAQKICAELAEGRSLRDVCSSDDMPGETTVRRWALEDREGFSAHYARARELGYLAMAEELLEIADNGQNDWMERHGDEDAGWQANGEHLQRSRLRVDTRKWMLSKVLPKVYGDKITTDHTSSDGSMTPKPGLDVSRLSTEALAEIVAAADAAKSG